jgi:hypothetical protein
MDLSYVMVDFQNITPTDVDLLVERRWLVRVFAGVEQRIPTPLFAQLKRMGDRADVIECPGSGRNALDFMIAFELGRTFHQHRLTAAVAPKAIEFFVVTHDHGFDPLLKHITAQGVPARRVGSVREMLGLPPNEAAAALSAPTAAPVKSSAGELPPTAAKPAAPNGKPAPTLAEDLKSICTHLLANAKNRPARRTTLERHIASAMLGRQLTGPEAAKLAAALEKGGHVRFVDGKVEYRLKQGTGAKA